MKYYLEYFYKIFCKQNKNRFLFSVFSGAARRFREINALSKRSLDGLCANNSRHLEGLPGLLLEFLANRSAKPLCHAGLLFFVATSCHADLVGVHVGPRDVVGPRDFVGHDVVGCL